MKKATLTALVLLPALLAGCSQIARSAADNREVEALPLGAQDFSGVLRSGATTLGAQALSYSATLTLQGSFDDLDLSSLPSIVGSPSGLDVPLAFATANFTACKTAAPVIHVTVTGATLTVSDAAHPNGATTSKSGLNIALTLIRNGDRYAVSFGGAPEATFLTLFADWPSFSPIVVKGGANTPNSYKASVSITADQGADLCPVSFRTPDKLAQRVRFQ